MLYKYFKPYVPLHHEPLFVERKLYFASPKDFNDPFDCRVTFAPENGTDTQYEERFFHLFEKTLGIEESRAREMAKDAIARGVHRSPDWPASRAKQIETLSTLGVCCFASKRDSLLMWAHYADSHRGFCLGFYPDRKGALYGVQSVDYREAYPTVSFLNDSEDEVVRKMLATKSKQWDYEGEWRVIDSDNGPGLRAYSQEALREVIFGVQMSDKDKLAIRDALKRGGQDPILLQARQNETAYELSFEALPR